MIRVFPWLYPVPSMAVWFLRSDGGDDLAEYLDVGGDIVAEGHRVAGQMRESFAGDRAGLVAGGGVGAS